MVIAPILRTINKGISTGIGLAGEKYHDHKGRKTALAQQDHKDGATSIQVAEFRQSGEKGDEIASDERIWSLDEAAGLPSYEEAEIQQHRPDVERTVSDLVHEVSVMRLADEEGHSREQTQLPYPIIIPQRRPGSRARGWARAYPPALDPMGLDQESFLRFLANFENAAQASPWLKTMYIAGNAVGFVPGHITLAVSLAVTIAAGTAIELQTRYKANKFLDQMNKDVFMPLGLYAMVLIYKDEPSKSGDVELGMEAFNMDTAKQVSKWGLPGQQAESTKTRILRPIRLTSGRAHPDTMPMEIAPLVYPGLEDMIARPEIKRDESFKERLLRNKEFVGDYFDRRARADYAGNNPDSALTKASSNVPEFSNRFADPNHPCNNGHLISLVTGGKICAQPRGRSSRLREKGEDGKLKPAVKRENKIRGPISLVTYPVRKIMTPNILYLTIVNLPSKAELAVARRELEIDQKGFKDLFAQAPGA
ncbi:hypothetical protein BKA63DRAFT_426854 [Paraphoma chrysanthemicola]|nr:hypothetical protein BKA63DRAFT_426854 [Paraphoma chrysanthemicola]